MLVTGADYIEHHKDDKAIRWAKADIIDIKFGKHPIHLTISSREEGESYTIAFLHFNNTYIHVQFYNLYYTKPDYPKIYEELLQFVRTDFLERFVKERIVDFEAKGQLQIGRLEITPTKIQVVDTGLFFTWKELLIRKHDTCFVLSKFNAPEFVFKIDFHEWHSRVTYELLLVLHRTQLQILGH